MLTDLAIRKAKASEKGYKLADERGLHLFVSPSAAKSFRLKYRYGGKEKLLTIGRWPDVPLVRARELATAARGVLAEGRDPGVVKRQEIATRVATTEMTLRAVAAEWHAKQNGRWSARQSATTWASLERDIFPMLGGLPVAEIGVPLLLVELNRIEKRSPETAHRIRRRLENVWGYAIATARAEANPAAQLRGTLLRFDRTRRQPAVLTLKEAREVYAACSRYPAQPETRACFQLLALTAVRPGDARGAAWTEFTGLDGSEPLWRIPAARMKGTLERKANATNEHVVPLSPEAVAIVEGIRPLTGHGVLVFPSPRFPKRPLTDLALSMLTRRAGFQDRHVPHGWRASFSTIMNDRHPDERAVIDAALAHSVRGVEGRYNRAGHLERRRELLAEWAKLLTGGEKI